MVLFYILFTIFVLVGLRLIRTALWLHTHNYWYTKFAQQDPKFKFDKNIKPIRAEAISEFRDGFQVLCVTGITSLLSYLNTLPFDTLLRI